MRRSNTEPIKNIISQFLKENNIDKRLDEQEMIRLWYDVTGKMVARATQSVEIRNRKMFVKLKSAVVRNELSMIRDGLIKELNHHFDTPLIDDIVLR